MRRETRHNTGDSERAVNYASAEDELINGRGWELGSWTAVLTALSGRMVAILRLFRGWRRIHESGDNTFRLPIYSPVRANLHQIPAAIRPDSFFDDPVFFHDGARIMLEFRVSHTGGEIPNVPAFIGRVDVEQLPHSWGEAFYAQVLVEKQGSNIGRD